MKLIKITKDHYVVVDDSEIKEGDYCTTHLNVIDVGKIHNSYTIFNPQNKEHLDMVKCCKKITHSTQPLYKNDFWAIQELKLSEVKELIGEVDVEKKAYRFRRNYQDSFEEMNECIMNDAIHRQKGYEAGYNQALEDNKEKKYTEEDMINAFREGTNAGALHESLSDYDNGDYEEAEQYSEQYEESFIQSLQPKTEWEIEEIDGKFKLK